MYFPWAILNPVDVLPLSELKTSAVKVEVGSRPGLPDPNRPYGLSGDVNNTELALDMTEGREMTEQTDCGGGGGGGAKQPSLEGRQWR